jgi:hypothetical protein
MEEGCRKRSFHMDLFDNVDLFAIVELPTHGLKKLYRGMSWP